MNKIGMKLARLAPLCIVHVILHHGRPIITRPLKSIIQSGVHLTFLGALPLLFVLPLRYPSIASKCRGKNVDNESH